VASSPTPTPTPTATPTVTSTPTATPTGTPSPTVTPTAPSPDIEVSGNGLTIAHGDTTPDAADNTDFGSVDVGGPSIVRRFTVSNTGSTALTVTGIGVPTSFEQTGVAIFRSPIAAGSSADFDVRCRPAADGTFNGNVDVYSNDPDEPMYSFAIVCVVNALIPDVDVTGNNVSIALGDTTPDAGDNTDFGSTSVGGTLRRDFRIHNRGNTPLTLTGLSATGGFEFAFPGSSGVSVGDSIGPLRSGTIRLECPSASAGTYTGTLSISTTDPDENPYEFTIRCQVN